MTMPFRFLLLVGLAGSVGVACIAGVLPAGPVQPGERLSAWLLRNPNDATFLPALQWQVPAEQASQGNLRQSLLESIQDHAGNAAWPAAEREALAAWLQALPLTGRLTVALPDARWLQVAPDQDPVLLSDQRVVLVSRPQTVTVMTDSGLPCAAVYTPGALIRDYLQACLPGDAADVDFVWLVQPDGRSTRYGVAPWNEQAQNEPAPGAWLWAPRRQAEVSDALSDGIARFLATQLPGELTWPSLHGADRQRLVPALALRAAPPRVAPVSASDWGEIGLLQTPTARMSPTSEVRFNVSAGFPYTRINTMFQRLDWLEGGFRYTDISNRLYGPASFSGDQSYKDKSLDVKVRVSQESSAWPEIALGVRDIGGTGLFSSEYVVANKRSGNFDWSLGLGWGYMAGRGNLKNPLAVFGDSYNTRPAADVGEGGTVTGSGFLRGPTALFGGVQWQSPSDAWAVKLELDGNDYQHEPFDNNLPAKSPFNIGLVYRYSPNVDLAMSFERGDRLLFALTLHGGLNQLQSPKLLDPRRVPIAPLAPLAPFTPLASAETPGVQWSGNVADTVAAIERYTGWHVQMLDHQAQSTRLLVETDGAVHLQERIDRALRVLHRDAPSSSRTFVITLQDHGIALSRLEVDRAEWVAQHLAPQPPALRLPAGTVSAASADAGAMPAAAAPLWASKPAALSVELGPSFSQIIGGPTAFVLYQAGVQAQLDYRFSPRTWVSGTFDGRLTDNYAGFNYDGPSELPRVRTLQREYVTSSRLTMPALQITHVQDLGDGHYASVYGGMLEFMYGGIGGEWLYRPWRGPLAVGVDINWVRQRGFNQDFAFRDYATTTGHATVYWDTGWHDLQVKLSAGQYLAKDVGATLDLNRVFPNGVALGAYATKTDVSSAQFGEGSFDKGIYVTIPFDVLLPRSTPGSGSLAWSPLTRDGGARLSRQFPLYDLTRMRDRHAFDWGPVPTTAPQSAEYTSYPVREPAGHLLSNIGSTTQNLGGQLAAVPASTWLWAGGAVAAASALDQPLDQWLQNNATGPGWDGAARISNAIPVAMALGTGLLYAGIGGEGASQTAAISIKAMGYTLAGNLVTRWAVGRARPYENLGTSHFDGFRPESVGSGFASNHVAIAFALATPFAQRHDMPWLYAAAGLSALGRLQQRDHWLSDTVAGAAMGYTIGSLLTLQDANKKGPRYTVTPQSVQAQWSFN